MDLVIGVSGIGTGGEPSKSQLDKLNGDDLANNGVYTSCKVKSLGDGTHAISRILCQGKVGLDLVNKARFPKIWSKFSEEMYLERAKENQASGNKKVRTKSMFVA